MVKETEDGDKVLVSLPNAPRGESALDLCLSESAFRMPPRETAGYVVPGAAASESLVESTEPVCPSVNGYYPRVAGLLVSG